MSGLRPSDQLQQSYATLRGRKWSEKNCRGIGDNYGRHHAAAVGVGRAQGRLGRQAQQGGHSGARQGVGEGVHGVGFRGFS